jgi:hypothetical protein
MRGDDEQQLDVFSYVSPEQRIPADHPLRPVRAMADEAMRDLKPCFSELYSQYGEAFDCSRKIAPCFAVASSVLGAQRTHADGATELQSVVPLVCRIEYG